MTVLERAFQLASSGQFLKLRKSSGLCLSSRHDVCMTSKRGGEAEKVEIRRWAEKTKDSKKENDNGCIK